MDGAAVYNVDPNPRSVLTCKEIVAKFPIVFSDRVGQLDEEYAIRPAPNAQPVQYPPRRVAVALRPQLQQTLDV